MDNIEKWRNALPQKTWENLQQLLTKTNAQRKSAEVYPPQDKVLRALELIDPHDIKVIIVGQDPYHGPGQANGLAFAVNTHTPAPPSLCNIDKELFREYGEHLLSTTLVGWAKQGVLLLNTSLTVEKGKPASHSAIGWQSVTESILETAIKNNTDCVVLAWGRHAQYIADQAVSPLIDKPTVIKTTHPSPLSATRPCGNVPAFIGSNCFKLTNNMLRFAAMEPIDWFMKG